MAAAGAGAGAGAGAYEPRLEGCLRMLKAAIVALIGAISFADEGDATDASPDAPCYRMEAQANEAAFEQLWKLDDLASNLPSHYNTDDLSCWGEVYGFVWGDSHIPSFEGKVLDACDAMSVKDLRDLLKQLRRRKRSGRTSPEEAQELLGVALVKVVRNSCIVCPYTFEEVMDMHLDSTDTHHVCPELSAKRRHMIRLLLTAGAKSDEPVWTDDDIYYPHSALYWVVRSGDIRYVRRFLRSGAQVTLALFELARELNDGRDDSYGVAGTATPYDRTEIVRELIPYHRCASATKIQSILRGVIGRRRVAAMRVVARARVPVPRPRTWAEVVAGSS